MDTLEVETRDINGKGRGGHIMLIEMLGWLSGDHRENLTSSLVG